MRICASHIFRTFEDWSTATNRIERDPKVIDAINLFFYFYGVHCFTGAINPSERNTHCDEAVNWWVRMRKKRNLYIGHFIVVRRKAKRRKRSRVACIRRLPELLRASFVTAGVQNPCDFTAAVVNLFTKKGKKKKLKCLFNEVRTEWKTGGRPTNERSEDARHTR